MKLRRFTLEGIQTFREFLAVCRKDGTTEPPKDLLEHRTFTEVVSPEVQIASNYFETKGEVAAYLCSVLQSLSPEIIRRDAGLWSWLSLLYFDSVCRVDSEGKRLPRNHAFYIFEPNNSRSYYRHLLFISWWIRQLAPVHNRLFLRSQLDILDQVTERVMSRLFLTRIPCIFEVLDRLYWDDHRSRPLAGITDQKVKAGNLRHRLPLRIRQLEKTYDLMSLTADQLLELLGDEFSFARSPSKTLFPESVNH